ncbi:MAG TPA: GNAT family N-acetyltransferase, partial [Solirubrobacteraceae bacterium]
AQKARGNLTVHKLTADDFSAHEAIVPPDQRRDVRKFFARRDVGYVAVVDGRFAGWIWISRVTHRDPWSGLWIRLAADEAYSYAMWVLPDYRALGVAGVLVSRLLSDARRDPAIRRVYGWIDRENRQSQTLLRLVFGFSQVQELKRVHLLNRVGFKLPRSDRPPFGPFSATGNHSRQPTATV